MAEMFSPHPFRFVLVVGLLALSAPVLAETPKDTVVMVKSIDGMISLDPAESFEFSGGEAIGNIYERLFARDPADPSSVKGELAQSWSLDEDGRTYRLTLKPGARFASGNPVTAEDAVWSLRRAVILGKAPSFILGQFGLDKGNVEQRILAQDASTVTVELGRAVAPGFFLACLTASVGSIIDRKEVEAQTAGADFGNGWLQAHSAGSGPYRLFVWRRQDHYTLVANENYGGPPPATPRIIVRHVKETATQRLMLEKGDADYARDLGKDDLDSLSHNPAIAFDRGPKDVLTYLGLNQRNPYLAKPEVRLALKYLVDYEGIERNILRGTRAVHQSFLSSGFLGAIPDRPFAYDLDKAKALLAKAGVGQGFKLTLDASLDYPWGDIAQAIQASWGRAGVELEILPGDSRQLLTKYRARRHDVFLGDWGADYPDPQSDAGAFAANPDNSDTGRDKTLAWRNAWDISEMTRRSAEAVEVADPKARAALYETLQREHQAQSPFVMLFEQMEVAAHRREVEGFSIGSSFDGDRFAGITKH